MKGESPAIFDLRSFCLSLRSRPPQRERRSFDTQIIALETQLERLKIARAVYHMLKNKTVFDPERLTAVLARN